MFADRYHARALRTPWEVRAALVYVLHNARKHGCGVVGVDPYTSGPWFDGWSDGGADAAAARACAHAVPVVSPRCWLLVDGWKEHGLIDLAETPAGLLRPARRRMASSGTQAPSRSPTVPTMPNRSEVGRP